MKCRILPFLMLLCVFMGCKDSDNTLLQLSSEKFEVEEQATTLTFNITSNADWVVASNAAWCTVSADKGTQNGQITLTISANPSNERQAIVAVTAGSVSRTVTITQGMHKVLNLSQSLFVTGQQATTLQVDVTANIDWKVSSDASWCTPNLTQGSSKGSIKLALQANTGNNDRTAVVTLTSTGITRSLEVTQTANIDPATYHFKLPVIFHMLYTDKADNLQYIDNGRLSTILTNVNKLYWERTGSVPNPDMNLEFTLATRTPQGEILSEPGVERLEYSNTTIDCETFMGTRNSIYQPLLWDPNQYINVFVYTFTKNTILGISHLPYTPTSNPLEGLYATDYLFNNLPDYPHCVSLNNTYIYVESTSTTYYTTDVNVTLAHELGHYLGLHHAFSEGDDGELDFCGDTDYCPDTPTYNSVEYNAWVDDYLSRVPQKDRKLVELATKKDCSDGEFLARNVMDYAFCASDQFTPDQRTRIRHVLANSPITPGPKNARTKSSGSSERPPIFYKK